MPKGVRGGRARKPVHAERTTRSSKAKNLQYGLEDPEQREKQLSVQLKAMGLYAANTLGDGNCLFRALSDQLYGYPSQHLYIRHAICDYLEAHSEKYECFVDDVKPFSAYVRNMRQQGTYGGHLELSAFANMKRKQIKIVQPNLVYVVAADESNAASSGASASTSNGSAIGGAEDDEEDLPLTTRQARRLRRDARSGEVSQTVEPGISTEDVPFGASNVASSSRVSLDDPGPLPPTTTPVLAPATPSTSFPSTPAATRRSPQQVPSASTRIAPSKSRASAPVSTLSEADGPLYIAYHNWEHYSSVRNLDGPHTGLPRIRERPFNKIDLAKEFSTIAEKAGGRVGLAPGKGKLKANTRPGTSSLDSEQPTEEEKLVMNSAPGHSLFEVRQLLQLLGSWEDVVEKLVAEDAPDGDEADDEAGRTQASSAEPPRERRLPSRVADDQIGHTDEEDATTATQRSLPAVSHQVRAIRGAAAEAAAQASGLAHNHAAAGSAWRAGSPSSVGTAASARSSASVLTTGTSTSASTVPTSDDLNAADITIGMRRSTGAQLGDAFKPVEDGLKARDDDQYLALSPDSTVTAREMSVVHDGPGPERDVLASPSVGSPGSERCPAFAFKRKAHHGHDVGADDDDDSEMSHKRFSPARGQFTAEHTHPNHRRGVVPSSVSPDPAPPSPEDGSFASQAVGERADNGAVARGVPAAAGKSGLTRLDAISVTSTSSSDADVPVDVLLASASVSIPGDGPSVRNGSKAALVPPSQQGQANGAATMPPASARARHGSGGGSTDDDSIASSRVRRTSTNRVDYRASAMGRTGQAGPGQLPTTTMPMPTPAPRGGGMKTRGVGAGGLSKRAKRDQKRAEKVEREQAKARQRRRQLGLGLSGRDGADADQGDDDDDEDEDGYDGRQAGDGVPAQFAFRELRI